MLDRHFRCSYFADVLIMCFASILSEWCKMIQLLLNGSILLNIQEVWPRPFWGGSSHQKKNTVDHFIGHIPFASLEGDKRPDKINQRSREFAHFMP